jgi:hypothetical protein
MGQPGVRFKAAGRFRGGAGSPQAGCSSRRRRGKMRDPGRGAANRTPRLRTGETMKTLFSAVVSALLALSLGTPSAGAHDFSISQTGVFAPQHKQVLLLANAAGNRKIILFQTPLRVNTDGSPLSYHPQDPRGRNKALNNVCNAIVVRKGASENNLCFTNFSEAIGTFEKFRDAGYQTVPSGFRITWANVLATVQANGKAVPCVFRSGPFEGYFGSLTALKNGLAANKGECEIDDQVNPMAVPALVLVGGQNTVRNFGAKVGDLLVAYNPKTQLFSSAIIGDTGPKDNLGEGSVLLNMKLLGLTTAPTNKAETFRLSIEDSPVLVAILPGSRSFRETRPYTADNIDQRAAQWQKDSGFQTPESFIDLMKSFQSKLK